MNDKIDELLGIYGAEHQPDAGKQEAILEDLRLKRWIEMTFVLPMESMRKSIDRAMNFKNLM